MEIMDIVNENDEIVGSASKKEIYEKRLLHRIVHIFIFNDRNEMALQLQGKNKKFCPLHWNTAAAGHPRSGESHEEAALRELEEEIGIRTDIDLKFKDIYEYKDRQGLKKILITFKGNHNGPFTVNPLEVEKAEFFTMDKIQKMIGNGEKFHPELLFLLRKHFNVR